MQKDLASFYGVSKQSALIRMVETGYKEAASIYQYDRSSDLHSYVDRNDAFYEYSTNPDFRRLIDSDLFPYVDGYFVINDEKYIIQDDNDALFITDYAWKHLSECTLQFKWQTLKGSDVHKHSPQKFFIGQILTEKHQHLKLTKIKLLFRCQRSSEKNERNSTSIIRFGKWEPSIRLVGS